MAYRSTAAKVIPPEVRQKRVKELQKARKKEIEEERIREEKDKAAYYTDSVKDLVSGERSTRKGVMPMRLHQYLANDLKWLYGEGIKYMGDEETIREPHMKEYKGKTPNEFFRGMFPNEVKRHAIIILGIVRSIRARLLDVARRGYEDVEKIYMEENRKDARNFFYPGKKMVGKRSPRIMHDLWRNEAILRAECDEWERYWEFVMIKGRKPKWRTWPWPSAGLSKYNNKPIDHVPDSIGKIMRMDKHKAMEVLKEADEIRSKNYKAKIKAAPGYKKEVERLGRRRLLRTRSIVDRYKDRIEATKRGRLRV